MANWTNLTFPFSSYLTALKLDQLVENLTAYTEGASGSPAIQSVAVQSGAVSANKFKLAEASIAANGLINAATASAFYEFNKYALFPHTMVYSTAVGAGSPPGSYSICCASGSTVGSADIPTFSFSRKVGTTIASTLIKYHYIDTGSF